MGRNLINKKERNHEGIHIYSGNLNVDLVINLLIAQIGGAWIGLNGMQIYVLAALELAVVIFAYVVGKRRTTTAYF